MKNNAKFMTSRSWQSRFAALLRELRARSTLSIRKILEERMELSRFRFLFVPGFHYRTDPSSGADFAGPRTYLRNCGFDTQLVEVEEDGTIEQNAAFIAAAVRKETSAGKLIRPIFCSLPAAVQVRVLAAGAHTQPGRSRQIPFERSWEQSS